MPPFVIFSLKLLKHIFIWSSFLNWCIVAWSSGLIASPMFTASSTSSWIFMWWLGSSWAATLSGICWDGPHPVIADRLLTYDGVACVLLLFDLLRRLYITPTAFGYGRFWIWLITLVRGFPSMLPLEWFMFTVFTPEGPYGFANGLSTFNVKLSRPPAP